jgi:hypothetical protein
MRTFNVKKVSTPDGLFVVVESEEFTLSLSMEEASALTDSLLAEMITYWISQLPEEQQ